MNVIGQVNLTGCNYQVGYDLLSQNTAGNYSTVRFYGVLNVTNATISWTRGTASVWSASSGLSTSYSRGSYTVVQQDVNLTHDANGNYSGILSGTLSTTFVSGTASGTFSLPQIKRKANITSAPNFNDEQNPTIGYSNPAGNNVSTLQACISLTGARDDIAYRNISKTGTSYTFNLTEVERNVLRNATTTSNSRTVKFYVKSIIGGTTFYSSVDRQLSIINANPTFNNFEFEDINPKTLALTNNSSINVNGHSNIKATITAENKAEALKSATMNKYRFSIDKQSLDISYSSNTTVSGVINNASIGTYNIYAIDSRNNSTLVTKLASQVINYEDVYIDKQMSSIKRNNNQVGKYAILTLNGTFWNGNFGNTTNSIKSVTYKYKKTNSNYWLNGSTVINPVINDNKFSFEGQIACDNTEWDLDSSYNVQVTVTDELSSYVADFILNSGIPTLSLDKNGVGIMCAFDSGKGGYLQINGKTLEEIIKGDEQ